MSPPHRIPLPMHLQFCTARELYDFFWRAVREKNKRELTLVREAMADRGIQLAQKEWQACERVMKG